MKKFISLLLALVMALSLVACGSKNNTDDTQTPAETVELTVFAAASLTESLTAIGEKYMAEKSNFSVAAAVANFSNTVSVTVIPPRHQSQTLQRRGCRQALAAAGSVFSPERWAALPAGLRIAPRRSCHGDSM